MYSKLQEKNCQKHSPSAFLKEKSGNKGKIRRDGFLRIATVAFLLFLAPAADINPVGPIS